MYSLLVCLCLPVSNIANKRVNGFSWNFSDRSCMEQRAFWKFYIDCLTPGLTVSHSRNKARRRSAHSECSLSINHLRYISSFCPILLFKLKLALVLITHFILGSRIMFGLCLSRFATHNCCRYYLPVASFTKGVNPPLTRNQWAFSQSRVNSHGKKKRPLMVACTQGNFTKL